MDDLEPLLVRHGYDARAVAELIGAKPGEVRLLLQGRLEASRVSRCSLLRYSETILIRALGIARNLVCCT